jgi:hypothetical protein
MERHGEERHLLGGESNSHMRRSCIAGSHGVGRSDDTCFAPSSLTPLYCSNIFPLLTVTGGLLGSKLILDLISLIIPSQDYEPQS